MRALKEELADRREALERYLEAESRIGVVLLDVALNIRDCNRGFSGMFELRQKPLGAPVANWLLLSDRDLKGTEAFKVSCSPQSGMNGILCCRSIETQGGYLLFCERLMLTESRAIEQIGIINNELINVQRELVRKNLLLEKLRQELDERVAELEDTLIRVKQLEGIIPICAYCKRIRDDQDDWQGLEQYITDHSEAQFSHGICPACLEREIREMEV